MECMASSDNVVRAGLTPKFKDVSTLCSMLSYKCQSIEQTIYPAEKSKSDSCNTIYDPPIPDFTVNKIEVY